MLKAHQVARRYLKIAAKRSKELYDVKKEFYNYSAGDLVWLLHESRKVGVAPKLERKFDGPYIIANKLSPITFEIQVDVRGTKRMAHHDKLKRYEGDTPPKWAIKVKYKLRSQTKPCVPLANP